MTLPDDDARPRLEFLFAVRSVLCSSQSNAVTFLPHELCLSN